MERRLLWSLAQVLASKLSQVVGAQEDSHLTKTLSNRLYTRLIRKYFIANSKRGQQYQQYHKRGMSRQIGALLGLYFLSMMLEHTDKSLAFVLDIGPRFTSLTP